MISSDLQTFLLMLTTQMQHQDPMNPIESSDFAVQLATFSGVEQQVKSNQLLEALATQMSVMGMAQFVSWVGMEARAAAPAWFDGAPLSLSPNPVSGADKAILVVTNAAGKEVERREIAVSTDPLEWAGQTSSGQTHPTGQYSFFLESYRNGTLLADNMIEVYAPITEARGSNGGTVLVLRGGASVAPGDISALRTPQ
jgi:flagellar basal-body rod modification protein FlgD